MPQPSGRSDADRNLLFGILALQLNFISRDALVEAMHAWALDKTTPLGRILIGKRKLTDEQLHALDVLVVQHLKIHGDDPEVSLQALGAASTARSTLGSITDSDLQSSLAKVGSETTVEETRSYSPPPPSAGARYRRLRHHVDGGLGKLYLAEDTELHREVALKEIKPEHADNLDSRGRFVLEAE